MHKVFINGRNNNKLFGCNNEYNAGDVVQFDALQPTDTSVYIKSEQLDRIERELVDPDGDANSLCLTRMFTSQLSIKAQ